MTIRAIETRYNGYRFRSRLEARWAIYFDYLGIEYQYEPEGYEIANGVWYLPDFYFPQWGCFGEVKPTTLSKDEYDKCSWLPMPCVLLDSIPEAGRSYYVTGAAADPDTYTTYTSGDDFGHAMLEQSHYKGRLWYLLGESAEHYHCTFEAIEAARSARFEHGEGQW